MFNEFGRGTSSQTAGVTILNNGTGTAQTTVNVGGNGFTDTLLTGAGYQWLAAQTPATTNYTFSCTVPNRVNVPAEINSRCGNVGVSKTMSSDANAQWVGFN